MRQILNYVGLYLGQKSQITFLIFASFSFSSAILINSALDSLNVQEKKEQSISIHILTEHIHSHPKTFEFGFLIWVWVFTQN